MLMDLNPTRLVAVLLAVVLIFSACSDEYNEVTTLESEIQSTTISEGSNVVDIGKTMKLIDEVTPHIIINKDNTLSVNQSIYSSGISDEAIHFAQDAILLSNQIAEDGNVFFAPQIHDNWVNRRLWPFFQSIADFCPLRISQPPLASKGAVIGQLILDDYHQTATYAGGNVNDYTLPVFFRGRPIQLNIASPRDGAYRYHAIINGGNYSIQGPEPNPEVFGYAWPAWWWAIYTHWWHVEFC